MLGVVVNIVHMGLLVGTQQGAHGVAQGDAAVLQVFEGVQAEDARTLVIGNAAPQQPAVAHAHGVGVGVPAVALGDNVGVGDGGKKLLPFGDGGGVRPADIAVGIIGVQTQLGGDLQRLVKGCLGTGAEGRARLGGTLDTGNGYQTGDVPQHGVAVLFGKGINGCPTRIIHSQKPPDGLFCSICSI